MSFPAKYGGITLGGVQFTTDPGVYQPLNWRKRYKARKCGGMALSIQDWGTWLADDRLRLGSGNNLSGGQQLLDTANVLELRTLYAAKGVDYALADWFGNAFTVRFSTFMPVFFAAQQLWTYDMTLVVRGITTLLGRAYVDGDAGTFGT